MFCIYSTMTNQHLTKKGCPTRHRFVICMGHTKSESLFWSLFLCIGLSVVFPHIANVLVGTTHLITSSWLSCASMFWFRRHFLALPCWYPCSVPPLLSLSASAYERMSPLVLMCLYFFSFGCFCLWLDCGAVMSLHEKVSLHERRLSWKKKAAPLQHWIAVFGLRS